jgi:Ca-activated chloride channel family protein
VSELTFGAPQWFWGLLALPLLLFLFVRGEARTRRRLQQFVSPHLLPQLAGTVNHFRRSVRFTLQLLSLALALTALAQPRWGYTFEEAKRKGIDLIVAADTSRSMLSNDIAPSRLDRVKLAAQDLLRELTGDRVGLIAFAGRAFVQAPLTIDYDAVVEAITDLDTKTIPLGGTNLAEAITLATQTYGKSAIGHRALVLFSDGEASEPPLKEAALKAAKAAAEAGVRIFSIGVGTTEGSLIPLGSEEPGSAFVKDSKGQVVKSRLDEKELREIAEATGGFYLHLENGPQTMRELFARGISQLQPADIDARLSRKPIERYEWPLGAAIFFLTMSVLLRERKRVRVISPAVVLPAPAAAAALLLLFLVPTASAAAPGLQSYQSGHFDRAFSEFQQTLKDHPGTRATDKLQFDAGDAAYKMKDYEKALEAFSQALLTPEPTLQSKSHYNLGNTLYQRGEIQKADDKKLADWTNALQHYEETLKLDPQDQEARDNYEFVKNKIEELKKKKEQQQQQQQKMPQPSPSPTPPVQPSDAAKRAKEEADRAVRRRAYRTAYHIITEQLKVDPTVNFYGDYIHRLEEINGIKKTDNP